MSNAFGWVCHLESDRRSGWDRVRLVVIQRHTNRSSDFLMSDGTWENVPEMEIVPETLERTIGIIFPANTINAFVEAVKEFKGDQLEPTTEVKVLREWLTVEKDRVDSILLNQTDLIKKAMLDS